MRIALDSNRYTDLCRGDSHAIEVVSRADEVLVPLIVIAEQRAGFALGSRRAENEKNLTRFLNTAGIFVLSPDEQTTHVYAEVYATLRRQGTPIPTNDIWIAALALQHSLILFARDKDFDHVPGLVRV